MMKNNFTINKLKKFNYQNFPPLKSICRKISRDKCNEISRYGTKFHQKIRETSRNSEKWQQSDLVHS